MKEKQGEKIQTIAVDGEEYQWRLRHSWIATGGEGLKGISISVWQIPERTRELIVDFPFSVFGLDRKPKPVYLVNALRSAIQAAMEAGWRPESRGRTFRFTVPEREETT